MKSDKKLQITFVPHMHWDREWYFTIDTANVLFNHNVKELLSKIKDQKMLLDGQWSLIDDYLKWNPEDKTHVINLLKNKSLACGPLYTQPDVFNSQGETLLRNFEMGKKIAWKLGITNSKTAYLPDTFGFSQNFPQIMKVSGMNNFVFWRGINKETLDQGDFFNWEGVDGSNIKSHVLRFGYFPFGGDYPYTSNKVIKRTNWALDFTNNLKSKLEKVNVEGSEMIFPLGGDQAPFEHNQIEFLQEVEKLTNDTLQLNVESSYDNFLDRYKSKLPTFKGDLRYPLTGKIHRTIGASRYDIKQLFRIAEDKLYYLLEPLEILYSSMDAKYSFEDYKDENILKPLFIAQTHDSLGACNTDVTNDNQYNRLLKIVDNIESQVDLLIKKIQFHKDINHHNLMFFNPSLSKADLFERKTIFTKFEEIDIRTADFTLLSLDKEQISFLDNAPMYKHDVLIFKKHLSPIQITSIDLEKRIKSSSLISSDVQNTIIVDGEFIIISFGYNALKYKIIAQKDLGDSYDYSPGEMIELRQVHEIAKVIWMNDANLYVQIKTQLSINEQPLFSEYFIDMEKESVELQMKLLNTIRNTKISMCIIQSGEVQKSQQLAITDFVEDDSFEDWNKLYSEFPAYVDINDGLVKVGKLNILTQGNNEIFKTSNGVNLTLYRTYQLVSGGAILWRPSVSGLTWKENSEDSQLQKQLTFRIGFSFGNTLMELSKFKYKPYSYYAQEANYIANKMSRFMINDIINPKSEKLPEIVVDQTKIFVSSIRKISDNSIMIRLVNMSETEFDAIVNVDNVSAIINFTKYKIHNIELERKADTWKMKN